MNNPFFGTIHYDTHLDMKLGYTNIRLSREMALFELETLDVIKMHFKAKAYESYSKKFDHFQLTFIFFSPNGREIHCSNEIMLKTKLTHAQM